MIIHGDCLTIMQQYSNNHFSAIVTDPPYGLKFMGKQWDYGIPGVEFWQEAFRIAKPGSFLLAFGGTRTFHRLTCAIEDAKWEIRDCLMWLYGQGFPKSHNHFGIDGYGTALKPAWEPIIMAMKPCEGTFAQNAKKWGQAGINYDKCRIPSKDVSGWSISGSKESENKSMSGKNYAREPKPDNPKGRWPANLLLDEEAASMLDEQSGLKASRFFYCAKASSSERDDSIHPTVKPLKLMEYLIKLVMPPKDGLLLDPFAGSGTTIVAAKRLGYEAVGIELQQEYCEIARKRIMR